MSSCVSKNRLGWTFQVIKQERYRLWVASKIGKKAIERASPTIFLSNRAWRLCLVSARGNFNFGFVSREEPLEPALSSEPEYGVPDTAKLKTFPEGYDLISFAMSRSFSCKGNVLPDPVFPG